ncbi:helix-turn-helix transcriptional regulator [Microterricola viridarii]|nr:LuxR C-terminal-related transcriptional regulator [Microterricola viridarii]
MRESAVENVERAAERQAAQRMIEAQQSGTLLVTGLSGMGKSQLLRAILPVKSGWKALYFKADAYEAKVPFAAAERLLRQLQPRGPIEPVSDAEANPRQMGALILAALDRVRTPVFLAIDDAQWLDPQSAIALRFAVQRLIDGRFFAAVASRPMTEPNALVDLLAGLVGRSEQHSELRLEPLSTEQVRAVAARLVHRGVSQRSARALREATGGSPALLNTALALSRDTAAVDAEADIWEAPIPVIDAARNPFARVAAAAPPEASAFGKICAVLRDPVEERVVADIAQALSLPADADAADAAGLVVRSRWRDETWVQPRHELLAHAVTKRMSASETLAVHRAAGEALDGRRGLRHSLAAASAVDDALLGRVLDIARSAASPAQADEAIGYLRSILLLCEPGDQHDDILIEIALLAMRFRRHQLVLDLLPLTEALPAGALATAISVEMLAVLGRIPEALAVAEQVVGEAAAPAGVVTDSAADRILAAHIAGIQAQFQLMTGDTGPIAAQVVRARALVDAVRPGDAAAADQRLRWMHTADGQHMRLLGWAITAAARSGDMAAFGAAFGELSMLIARADASPELVDALVTRAGVQMQSGDVGAVHAGMLMASATLVRSPHAWTAGHVRVILSHVQYLLGDWDGAEAGAEAALSLAMDETAFTVRPVTHFTAALVSASRGDASEVAALLEAGERATISRHESYESSMAAVAAAELARAMGNPAEQLRACSDPALRAMVSTTHGWKTYQVEALAALGRVAEARAALADIRETARWQPHYGSALWLEARIEDAADRRKSAKALYERAVAEPDAALFPFPLARARADYGRFLLRVGDAPGAIAQLTTAAEVFTRLGATPDLERTLALLERAGGNGAAVSADPFGALTVRERQIAQHAARGHTNREIAETLFLSVTTVNFHMRNVLPKLGLSSRRGLRALAPQGQPT